MPRPWIFPVALQPSSGTPIHVQIARAIADDIARERLRPGDTLPGTRTLAESLGVHRNTVVAAYAELAAQGWVEGRAGHGTQVAVAPPEERPRRFATRVSPRSRVPPRAGFEVVPLALAVSAPVPPDTIALWGGVPDLRLVPRAALGRAWRRAAQRHGQQLLDYVDDARGHPRLRSALARTLSATRGLAAGPDDVLIVRGAQMALYLVARALLRPGDTVAVESLGYKPAWAAFTRAGARLAPIPVDGDGLDVSALERRLESGRLRLLYVTPHHQYPTTVTLAPARRLALLQLAQRHRMAILEDDYDHEFHYDGRPVLPLASADRAGVVVYVGSLAKIFAPGVRLGFVVAPPELLKRLTHERRLVDRQGDQVLEEAVAELLEDGELQRHVRRARRIYQRRRSILSDALGARLGEALTFGMPAGGLCLWARAKGRTDVDAWLSRCARRGVLFQTGRQFTFDGARIPYVRLGFAMASEAELLEAVERMASAL